MAENRGDQGAMATAVQMPRELPSIYRWVSNDVLGAPSILDLGYLDKLKETGILFGGGGSGAAVMFIDNGVRVLFTDFQQRLLNRASMAPSQLHPNNWSSVRYFELVPEFLQLPQEPEVSFDIAPVTYQGLNANQKDRTDIPTFLFSKNNLSSKSLLGNPEEARRAILEMGGNDVTLACLRNLLHPPPARVIPTATGPSSVGRVVSPPIVPATETRVVAKGGSSSKVGRASDQLVDVSSPIL
ncbi:hypothetical protein PIB30_074267 [Stylosanthes scabra]|uniref:Uncharacterized protein n=1 Tax=Stylosanthes scabra TaxID=79078 RepID=A0ABU6UPK5_9FABA|nr:hypothetical protein [Stylosanthes scabra]